MFEATACLLEGNAIANNGGDGISLTGEPRPVGNSFLDNAIYANGGLGIEVDPDVLRGFPNPYYCEYIG